MAILINRTIRDAATMATFEVVTSAGADADTVVDASALEGADGSGREKVRLHSVTALVCGDDSSADISVTLAWAGGTTFMTLPKGFTQLTMLCDPPRGTNGDITFTSSSGATHFTMRLVIEKITGFPLSTANNPQLTDAT
jgi:hypothetical protein